MKLSSKAASHTVFVSLAALMLATRFHHFGTVLHLPDASMAIFFLGGLYLRRHWQFAALALLAGVIDWAAVSLAGVSDFCITPAYSFLLPAYAVLWYGARLCSPGARPTPGWAAMTLAVGLACATLSFAISNGAFYWLGGRYVDPNMTEYVERALHWAPMFVRTALVYITAAVLLHALAARLLPARAGGARA